MKKTLFSLLLTFIGLAAFTQVQVGTSTSTTSSYPVNCFYDYSYSEQIYLQSEINASGNIDTLSFYFNGGGSATSSSDWTIYMGHTSKTSYSGSSDWITSTGLTQVYVGTITVPASGWFKIGLDSPFPYNNIDNLVVSVDENSAGFDGSGRSWRVTNSGSTRAIYIYQDGSNVDPSSPGFGDGTSVNLSNIIFGGITQSCPNPSAITPYGLSSDSVNITWTNGANDVSWIVEYGVDGFTLGAGTTINANNDSITLNGLTQDTPYDVYLKSICAVGDSSEWVGPFSFTTLQTCPAPNALSAFATSSDSTKITWIDGLNDSAWIIEYGEDGFVVGTGTVVLTDTNINTIVGLTQNTDYDVYLRSVCTVGDTSVLVGPYSFTTLCGIETLPYVQDFNTYLPGCWEEAAGRLGVGNTTFTSTTSSDWKGGDYLYVSANGKSAKINNFGTTRDEWLISPSFDLGNGSTTYQVDFDVALTNYNSTGTDAFGVDDTLALVISTDNGVTWNQAGIISQWDATNPLTNLGEFVAFNLSAYTGTVKFGFYAASSVSNTDYDLYVNNFRVREVPSCPEPTGFTSYFVGSDSVSLTWSAGALDSVWLVEYGTTGFTPGTGTTMVSNNDSLVLTGLAGATTYDFYLRGICPLGDTGIYVGPITETTNCPIAFIPAYSQDFTSYVPDCWTEAKGILTDSTTFTSTSSFWTSDGFGNVGSSGSARMEIWSTNRHEWLMSPSFDLGNGSTTYQLEFDVALTFWNSTASDVLGPDDTLALVVSTDNGVTWSDTNILKLWNENNEPSNTGDRVKIRLTGYTDTVKFGYYAKSTTSNEDVNVYIDNFDVIVAPTCPEGDSLTVVKYGSDTAMLTWNPGLFDNSWVIQYDTAGFALGTGSTILASNDTTTVSGLTPLTTYDFYVRSICAVGDSSLWIGPLTVSTKADCPAPTTISDFLLARDSNNITWNVDPADSLYYIEWDTVGFTIGTGNMVTQSDDTIALTGLTPNTTYSFYVRTLCKSVDTSAWAGPYTFTTVESCPVVSSVSEFNTTKDSANLTWVSGQYDSVWLIEYDTAGFAVGTGNTITATTDTIGVNGLMSNTTYQVYVRSICTAGDTSALVGPFSFTTLESCPSVDSLFNYGTSVDSTNISWINGFYDSSWIVEYGVAGFATGSGTVISVSNNMLPINGLMAATEYDVYVRSICSVGDTSSLVGPLTFTTNIGNPSACGLDFDIPDNTCGTSGNEYTITVASAIGTQLGTDVVLKEVRTIITHTWAGDIEMRLVSPSGDTVELTTDNGGSSSNYGDTTGGCTQYTAFNMEGFTNITSGSAPFIGSYIPEGDLNDFNDNSSPIGDWKLLLCDDASGDFGSLQFIELVFDLPLTCPRPDSIQAYGAGKDSVNLTWVPGVNDVSWIVEYGVKGFAQGTGNTVLAANDSITISGLSSDTEYDFYVRGFCGVGDSSVWIGPATDTTLPLCVRAQAFTVLSATGNSINVGWNLDPSHTSYIVEYGPVGYTPGTGTTQTTAVPNNFVSVAGLTPSTEYEFYIKAVCNSGDTSVWDGPYIGSTECSTVSIPWTESFESVNPVGDALMPLCMVEDGDWETVNGPLTYNRAPRTGNQYLTVDYNADDWVFTPKFDLDTSGVYEFSFWYLTDGLTGWDEVSLHAGTDQLSTAMTTVIGNELNPSHTTYKEMKGYFKPTTNGVYAFGVYVDGPSFSPWYLTFDDFNVRDTTQFVSIDELNELSQFEVYPNPNTGEFTILNEGNSLNTVVKVLDIQGRIVYDENVYFSYNDRREISLTNVNTGMYILQINNEGRTQQIRLVIE